MKSLLSPKLTKVLRKIIDPELGINIVDLGLIYQAKLTAPDKAYIQMTLTSPGCPLAYVFDQLVRDELKSIGIKKIQLELTFDPPWTPDRLSPRAKAKLPF